MHSQPPISLLVVACTTSVSHCFRDCGTSAMPRSKRVMKDGNRSDVPITFEFQMSIRGGRLKQATVIPLDVVLHGGSECRFTLVSHRRPWLCEMVSGVRQWSSPLKGASMVRRLKAAGGSFDTSRDCGVRDCTSHGRQDGWLPRQR